MTSDNIVGQLVNAILIGLFGWMAWAITSVQQNQATFAEQIRNIERSIISIETEQVTVKDLILIDSRIKRLEEWNSNLSTRIRNLEQELRVHE